MQVQWNEESFLSSYQYIDGLDDINEDLVLFVLDTL